MVAAPTMNEGQREILYIIAELSNRTVTTTVRDTAVVEISGLPVEEVYMIILIN